MRSRIVPASEITAKKGLKADTYIRTDEVRRVEKRLMTLSKFSIARGHYLEANGWVMRDHLSDAPRWWKDPCPQPDEQEYYREDQAVWVQEMRDNALMEE